MLKPGAAGVPETCDELVCSAQQCAVLQIDLRYANPDEGGLEVVVAPVMRFKDIDFNANVKIEDIAPPDRIISGFALEIFGAPLAVGCSLCAPYLFVSFASAAMLISDCKHSWHQVCCGKTGV